MTPFQYEKRLRAYLAALTVDAEFFGLLGRGYPTSFYKLYVRAAGDATWWRFEMGGEPYRSPVGVDRSPLIMQSKIPVAGRAATVWAPLPRLADCDVMHSRDGLERVYVRARELRDNLLQGGSK